MIDSAAVTTNSPALSNRFRLAVDWLTGAWVIFRRDPWLWIGMAFLFFVAAILLKRIPWMGNLVVILFAPIPLASAMLLAREFSTGPGVAAVPAIPGSWVERRRFFLERPLAALLRSLREENAAFPLAFLCVVTLGVVIAVVMFEYAVAGGSVISGIGGARYSGAGFRVTALIGGTVAVAAYAVLLAALFHLVPLVFLGGRLALPALAESVLVWRRALKPLLLFVVMFVVAYLPFAFAFASSGTHWLGYLLVFTVGTVLLPLFVIGNYLSFRALHGDTGATT